MTVQQLPPHASPPPLHRGAARQTDRAPARVLRQLRGLWRAVDRQRHQGDRPAGLGSAQIWALRVVADRPGLGVNELADALGVRQPTASNLVHCLCERELVVRLPGRVDRRAAQLQVSSQGRELLERLPSRAGDGLEAALRRLDPTILHSLEHDLALLLGRLGRLDAERPAGRGSRPPA